MTSTSIDAIIKDHGPAIRAYAIQLTGGDRHLAEDVVQETWLRAWKNADRLTEELGSIRGWLRRIAHNVAIDQHRSRKARPTEVNLPEPVLHNAATVADPADGINTRLDLDDALDSLSPAHRSTVVQVYFEDHTTATTATLLGIPAGTVKSRIHNALNNLRTTLIGPPELASRATGTTTSRHIPLHEPGVNSPWTRSRERGVRVVQR